MKKFHPLASLGGIRPELGAVSSIDRVTYGGLGSLLLVTGATGGLGMWILAQMLFGLNWALALIPAAIWAICVIAIDRALTSTFPDTLSRRIILPILGRLAIALVIGLIVSTPITLQLFKGEIDVKIATLQAQLREDLNAQNSADPLVARVPALRESIAAAEETIATGPAAARTDQTYVDASAAASAAQADWSAKTEALNAEAQGTGGTGVRGDGPVAAVLEEGVDAAYEIYQSREAEAAEALADATAATTAAIAAAETSLPVDEALLTQALAREAELTAANESRVLAAGGLHNRLDALFELARESVSGFGIHAAWFLFFLFIEMLPVLYKLTMVGRKPTAEAQRLALEDEATVVRARERLKRDTADAESETAVAMALAGARQEVGLDGAERERLRGLWENEQLDEAHREAVVGHAEWVRTNEPWRERASAASPKAPEDDVVHDESPVDPIVVDEPTPPYTPVKVDVDNQAWDLEEPQRPTEPTDSASNGPTIVGERFLLVERYQSGSTEVWRAVDLSDEGRASVAVKLLPGTPPDDDDAEERFVLVANEVKMVRNLPEHDNVMKVLTAGVTDDTHQWWYASPWYGPSLHAYLARHYRAGKVDAMPQLITVVEYVRDAALGLAAAHAKGISHGDIKPGNLVLDEITRRVRVIDFGLARTVETLSSARSQTPKGTIFYSAPELTVRGDGGQSPFLADIFSLGGVLYFLLTGQRPRFRPEYVNARVEDVVLSILDGSLTLTPMSSDLPQELVAITVRALAPDPDYRFGYWAPQLAAKEFADALDEMMQRWGRDVRQMRVGPQLLAEGPTNWETRYHRAAPAGNDDTEATGTASEETGLSEPTEAATQSESDSGTNAAFDPFDELVFPTTTNTPPQEPIASTETEELPFDEPDTVDDAPTEIMPPTHPSPAR